MTKFQSFSHNIILAGTDSYKASHWLQYPEGTTGLFSYIESRGGKYDKTVLFGVQMFIQEYMTTRVTEKMVQVAKGFYAKHGLPFNEEGWMRVVKDLGGYLPVRIKCAPEGLPIPTHNVLVTIESTDPELYWIVNYVETALLRGVWYPTTVCTNSWMCKQVIRGYLDKTSDDPEGQILFKLHDFGARGVSSLESAAIGGAAHLVNFMGSDTVPGVVAANLYYNCDMAGYSIPAAEHSTITAWGKSYEEEAYRNMLKQFGKPGALLAVVSDSYDIFNACEKLWGEKLREEVIASGATVVIRPDSGDPVEVVTKCLQILDAKYGSVMNSKGYKVLNNVRLIQGDGINQDSIDAILASAMANGFSADNIGFGMGGALLQQLDRDTCKFAMKCSAIHRGGIWCGVSKDPVTDSGKRSKRGRISLYRNEEGYFTAMMDEMSAGPKNGAAEVLKVVFENGIALNTVTFDQVRANTSVA